MNTLLPLARSNNLDAAQLSVTQNADPLQEYCFLRQRSCAPISQVCFRIAGEKRCLNGVLSKEEELLGCQGFSQSVGRRVDFSALPRFERKAKCAFL